MKRKNKSAFDAEIFLESVRVSRRVAEFRRQQTAFSQGDAADSVMYVQKGSVKFTVVNAQLTVKDSPRFSETSNGPIILLSNSIVNQ
jgi:CRP-like cAMP-binding protein